MDYKRNDVAESDKNEFIRFRSNEFIGVGDRSYIYIVWVIYINSGISLFVLLLYLALFKSVL